MANQSARRAPRPWLVPAAIVAVAVALVVLVLTLNGGDDEPAGTTQQQPTSGPTEASDPQQPDLTAIERRDAEDVLAAGPTDAPVTLVVFSDYQCGYCARWSEETLPLMMEKVESGDLRIEWRDVNIFGEPSERAARASYAAGLQGSFWEFHDALFPDGEPRSESELSDDGLLTLAGELGLDTDQFATDYDAEPAAAEIGRNAQLGQELGASSTPSFIFGGQPIVGAQPSQVFLDAFDSAMAAAG